MVNKVNKWIIAIAIAIVFNLFMNYGIQTFYKGPDYNDYCNQVSAPYYARPVMAEQNCTTLKANQTLAESCQQTKGYINYKYDSNGCPNEEYCETCQVQYDDVRKKHDGNVFIFLIVAAVIILGAGLVTKAEAVSAGLLMAGILDLIIASVRYWEHLQNIFRFLLLGFVLAVLLWLGYKKVR